MIEKAELRRSMKKTLAALDDETFSVQGVEAGKLIAADSVWQNAGTILSFMSMQKEIETRFLLDEALSSGKNLFLPRIIDDTMSFFKIDSLDGPWDEGVFGILEPKMNHVNHFHINTINFPLLIIVPGLAFDRSGHRLGRGKGYYDRFLSELKNSSAGNNSQNITIVGLCVKEQLVDHIPTEDYDQKVDAICTGNSYIRIN
jgi:5-formyltetrahydrofolate cyclo-ligase